MRACLVVNPKAGDNRGAAMVTTIAGRLRSLTPSLDVVLGDTEAQVVRAAEEAREAGTDVLFVAGGDGTLNAALRGLLSARAHRMPVVGLVPLGTGNDFAKALNLGESVEPAIEKLLSARVVQVDVGRLNDRPFVNTSAGGFVGDVSAALTERLKDAAGKLAYVIGGARALFGSEPFAAKIAVTPDPSSAATEVMEAPIQAQMFAVCNARFIGGGYPIAPDALVDDGLLDAFVVPSMPLLEFAAVLQRIATGEHLSDGRLISFRAREFTLTFDRPVRANTDGEPLEVQECLYRVDQRALTFLCGDHPHSVSPPGPL